MSYLLELQKIRLKLGNTNRVEERINLLKEAIQLSDRDNDIENGYDFRLDLILEEAGTSRCLESFSAFTWVLDKADKNPELFEDSEFLWEYRSMSLASFRNADISQQQIDVILDDFKNRIEKNGYSLAAYYNIGVRYCHFTGDLDKADHYLQLRDEQEKDDLSYCKACEKDADINQMVERGNYEEAVQETEALFTGKESCNRSPFNISCLLASHLQKIKHPKAAYFFTKAEEEFQKRDDDDSSIIESVSYLINYLQYTHTEEAFRLFEKTALWEIQAEDSFKYQYGKNIFRLFAAGGEKELNLPSQHPLYQATGKYLLKDLEQYYYKNAEALAQKFDARSGLTYFARNLEKELQA